MKKISIIAASNGMNLTLANKFQEELTAQGASCVVYDLAEQDLPLYSPKRQKEEGIHDDILKLTEEFKATDAFVFVAPEYNGGLPPTLTNLIAWVSVCTKDWREAFNDKSAVIATHSGGGGMNLLAMMRVQLAYIGLNVLGRQVHTHYKKALNEDSLKAVCSNLLK